MCIGRYCQGASIAEVEPLQSYCALHLASTRRSESSLTPLYAAVPALRLDPTSLRSLHFESGSIK